MNWQREVLLPKFDIPKEFEHPSDATEGTNHGRMLTSAILSYEGAKKRYGTLTDEIKERLDFELQTIENTGYPGYFLIVEDFIRKEARNMDVSVSQGVVLPQVLWWPIVFGLQILILSNTIYFF